MVSLKRLSPSLCLLILLQSCSMQPLIDIGIEQPKPPVYEPLPAPELEPAPRQEVPQEPVRTEDSRQIEQAEIADLPSAAALLSAQAEAHIQNGQYGVAIAKLERAVKIAPKSPELYVALAEVYQLSGQQARAAAFANKARSFGLTPALRSQLSQLGL